MYHNSAIPKAKTVWSGGDRGGWWDEKTTDEVGCLNTLMNSLNEVISVHFCATTNVSVNRQKFKNA